MKGFAAFHDTMVRADDVLERLEKKPWSGPAAVMLAEHDGLVETEDLLARFDRAFPNPRTRIFWYGEERFARGLSAHVRILPEAVPEKRIASFSHMSMTYRPDNPMYGESGRSASAGTVSRRPNPRPARKAPRSGIRASAISRATGATARSSPSILGTTSSSRAFST